MPTPSKNNPLITGKNKTQVTPQSALGELGQSLLKFITPIRSVKAHIVEQDYLDGALTNRAIKKSENSSTAASTAASTTNGAPINTALDPKKIKPGDEGSGYIVVSRNPRAPWLEMVTDIQEACTEKSRTTRSTLGAQMYGDASRNNAELRRKTVGRIVNIVTEDDDAREETPAQTNTSTSKSSDRKLLTNQYELDGKPKKKVA